MIGETYDAGAVERTLLGEGAFQAVLGRGPRGIHGLDIGMIMARITSQPLS